MAEHLRTPGWFVPVPLLFVFATASCCLLKKINLFEEFITNVRRFAE